MITKSDLSYQYPEHLVALKPQRPSRVMYVPHQLKQPQPEQSHEQSHEQSQKIPQEISMHELLLKPQAGDVWVINDTKVSHRRIWSQEGFEILFLNSVVTPLKTSSKDLSLNASDVGSERWEVLFPSSRLKKNQKLILPEGIQMGLVSGGKPQIVELSKTIDETYFQRHGELPLPPYIQKLRNDRHQTSDDETWYQTSWANKLGSLAAPTASLHFDWHQIEQLTQRGVVVCKTTLHVGLGTFLPVTSENLTDHPMHYEWAHVSQDVWKAINEAKQKGHRIWSVGTTVARTLESLASQKLIQNEFGFEGQTNLFIYPGYEYKVVDVLLTNFHQPESTLLALVAAFSGLENVKTAYEWAIQNNFRLFSYGDLSVWEKPN